MTTSETSRLNRYYPMPPAYVEQLLPYYDPKKDGRLAHWLSENISAYIKKIDLSVPLPVPAVDPTATITVSDADHELLMALCKKHKLNRREAMRYVLGCFVTQGPLVSAKEPV